MIGGFEGLAQRLSDAPINAGLAEPFVELPGPVLIGDLAQESPAVALQELVAAVAADEGPLVNV